MANEIKTLSPEEVRYWDVQNIPTELIKELRRRKNSNNIGFEIPNNIVSNFKREHKNYKGSLSPWIRIFSNGTGVRNNERVPKSAYLGNTSYDGFILESGKSFNDAYGLSRGTNGESIFNSDSKAIIGYQANGSEHYIDQKYRESIYKMSAEFDPNFPQNSSAPSIIPPPGIESVSINTSADMLTYGEFKLKCFTLAQIEYLTPFFLTPGIHIFVEFGWNLYNRESLLDLENVPELKNIVDIPYNGIKRTLNSYGNYGLVSGIITNYNFTTNDGFEYECNIKITDKQALFAGFRVDVDANKKTNDESQSSQSSFMNIKSFFKQYLSFAKDVIGGGSNFYNYINSIQQKVIAYEELQKYLDQGYEELDNSKIIRETSEKGKKLSYDVIVFKRNTGKVLTSKFYNNEPEDRIFFGRNNNIDGTLVAPKQVLETVKRDLGIDYSFTISDEQAEEQKYAKANEIRENLLHYGDNEYSDQDQHDFDRNESSNEVWFTLGFVFENINFKCNSKLNKVNFTVDIDDVIVNAHPNLISCNPNVLIPNSIAPKINIGRKWTDDTELKGYLPEENTTNNKYFNQNDYNRKVAAPEKVKLAYEKNQKVFRTQFVGFRQDLDKIINYRRFRTEDERQYAFPQVKENTLGDNTFEEYRHGYLKDLYISKRKLIDISKDDDIKTLQQFIHAILNTINESVNNFWEFDVVSNGKGGFIIVDKGINSLTKIYQFELYSDNSVIKSINFDVSLSNEQAAQTLFGTGNNKSDTDDGNQITLGQKSIPTISYSDRFDKYNTNSTTADSSELSEKEKDRKRQIEKYGIPNDDRNREIEKLQIYGKQECLIMTTMKFRGDISDEDIDLGGENLYYMLNLPSSLSGKMLEILDDGDYNNNSAVYSNVADNFLIEVTLDGIYGFRMFQHFSINNLPKPYVPGNCIFMIKEISHQISDGNWETKITAMLKGTVPNKIEYELI